MNWQLKKATTLRGMHIGDLVYPDQTGFMKGREAKDNTIRALHLLHWMQHGPEKAPKIVLSMDAEKAFDRVNWGFMSEVLRGVGLGDRMMGWVMALYAGPRARVKVNGTISDYLNIRNGTRQSCPLSPLIFALILEPFLCKIRSNGEIVGTCIGDVEQSIGLC